MTVIMVKFLFFVNWVQKFITYLARTPLSNPWLSGVAVNENDREALVRLAQYVVHASFSLEKIRHVEKTNCVMYKSSPAKLDKNLNNRNNAAKSVYVTIKGS